MNLLVTHNLLYFVAGVTMGTCSFLDSVLVSCDRSVLCTAVRSYYGSGYHIDRPACFLGWRHVAE